MTSDQRILVGWSTYLHTWTYSSKHISEDNTRWLQGFGFRREAAHRGGISAHLAAGCLKLSLLSWRVGEKSSSVNTDAHIQNTSSRSSAQTRILIRNFLNIQREINTIFDFILWYAGTENKVNLHVDEGPDDLWESGGVNMCLAHGGNSLKNKERAHFRTRIQLFRFHKLITLFG